MSIVGTTTRVLDSSGIPAEKSRRGSGCGLTSNVASQFTRAIARWLAPKSERITDQPRAARPDNPSACAFASKLAGNDGRNQRDRAEYTAKETGGSICASASKGERRGSNGPLELRQSLIDQVKADMGRAVAAAFPGRALKASWIASRATWLSECRQFLAISSTTWR